ncbi:MAG: RluA family pseudouridine synthase [Myxococcaceae bacterium]
MSHLKQAQVSDSDAGARVDVFICKAFGLSRATAKALTEAGEVRVDGKRARKGERLILGASVSVQVPSGERAPTPDAEAALSVLLSDTHLVFIDKPAGAPSHPLKSGERGTVANALVARFPECATASTDPREGGLAHRLDTDTSGVMVAARDADTWEKLRARFTDRAVEKQYWALVAGPLADAGELGFPLKQRKDRVDTALEGDPDAREAKSTFRVLARAGDVSLVEVTLLTGVMHQVRAHLAAIGAPLIGDALYGGRPGPTRFLLHARALGFVHPVTGHPVRVEAPLPKDFAAEFERQGLQLPPTVRDELLST